MILEKNFWESTRKKKAGRICSDINKSINSQDISENRFSNWFPYCNENDGIWTKIKHRNTGFDKTLTPGQLTSYWPPYSVIPLKVIGKPPYSVTPLKVIGKKKHCTNQVHKYHDTCNTSDTLARYTNRKCFCNVVSGLSLVLHPGSSSSWGLHVAGKSWTVSRVNFRNVLYQFGSFIAPV